MNVIFTFQYNMYFSIIDHNYYSIHDSQENKPITYRNNLVNIISFYNIITFLNMNEKTLNHNNFWT
jgi:hypothetical protein